MNHDSDGYITFMSIIEVMMDLTNKREKLWGIVFLGFCLLGDVAFIISSVPGIWDSSPVWNWNCFRASKKWGVEPEIGVGNYPPNHPFVHRGLEPLFSPSILVVFPLFLETPKCKKSRENKETPQPTHRSSKTPKNRRKKPEALHNLDQRPHDHNRRLVRNRDD